MKKSSFLMFLSFTIIFSILGCKGDVAYLSKRYIPKVQFLGEKNVGLISLFSEFNLKKTVIKYAQQKLDKRLERQIKKSSPNWSLQKIDPEEIINKIKDELGYEDFWTKTGEKSYRYDKIKYLAFYKKYLATLIKNYPQVKYFIFPSLSVKRVNILQNCLFFDGRAIKVSSSTTQQGKANIVYTGNYPCLSLNLHIINRNSEVVFSGAGGIASFLRTDWKTTKLDNLDNIFSKNNIIQALEIIFREFSSEKNI